MRMLNQKTRTKIEKLARLYNDSYDRHDFEDMEWMACQRQGERQIQKILVGLGIEEKQARVIASNVFHMFAKKENWCPAPNKDPRGEQWHKTFENGLRLLKINYRIRDYGYGGMTFILK